jgi:hypothetical protein
VERNSFIGNNKLLGAEMLGYTSEDFFPQTTPSAVI